MLSGQEREQTTVLVIGAGAAGLCMAYELRRKRVPFILLEKANALGGTWRDNTYPGAGCDVVSSLYSFSFAPNPQWSRRFAGQPEIQNYLVAVAERFDLMRHIRFGEEVAAAWFDEGTGRWHIKTAKGSDFTARFLVSAVGQLNRPSIPKIEDHDMFKGASFHSAQWDHSYNFTGKRVAVVGSGASAIQFLPHLARQDASIILFQRSPNWIIRKDDWAVPLARKRHLGRWNWLMRLERWREFWALEMTFPAFLKNSRLGRRWERQCRTTISTAIEDEGLRQAVTPDYPVGCKRVLLSNDWFETLARDNVEVVPQAVSSMTADGIVAGDGTHHPVDLVIFATGFKSLDLLSPMQIAGRDGLPLDHAWAPHPHAYLGVAVPEMPNFFILYGPNTNLGHGSAFFMLECQASYVARLVSKSLAKSWRTIAPTKEAAARFANRLQRDMSKTVWVGGCSSWYKGADGVVVNNWSGTMTAYWWKLLRIREQDFELT